MFQNTSHSCQSLLPRVERPEEQLLTFGINFPLIEQFKEQPERVFLEDMEIFTFIPRVIFHSAKIHFLFVYFKEAIVIYRRGCSPDRSAYDFQIGILESTCQHVKPRLRTLSPRIFLSNRFFMQENALKIGYIQAGWILRWINPFCPIIIFICPSFFHCHSLKPNKPSDLTIVKFLVYFNV